MKRMKKQLVHVDQRIFLDAMFTRHESTPRSRVLLLVVLGYIPTAPATKKATILSEAHLDTHKPPNDLEVTTETETPLVLVVLCVGNQLTWTDQTHLCSSTTCFLCLFYSHRYVCKYVLVLEKSSWTVKAGLSLSMKIVSRLPSVYDVKLFEASDNVIRFWIMGLYNRRV